MRKDWIYQGVWRDGSLWDSWPRADVFSTEQAGWWPTIQRLAHWEQGCRLQQIGGCMHKADMSYEEAGRLDRMLAGLRTNWRIAGWLSMTLQGKT